MLQAATLGLLRAVLKFKPHSGFKLSTYATWWIRQELQRSSAASADVLR